MTDNLWGPDFYEPRELRIVLVSPSTDTRLVEHFVRCAGCDADAEVEAYLRPDEDLVFSLVPRDPGHHAHDLLESPRST